MSTADGAANGKRASGKKGSRGPSLGAAGRVLLLPHFLLLLLLNFNIYKNISKSEKLQ